MQLKTLRPLFAQTRRLLLAGPLRPALVAYYRAVTHPTPIKTNALPYVEPFNIEATAQSLYENGFASGVSLTQTCVEKLLACYETNPVQSYNNPHHDYDFITQIAHNEQLVTVARMYLKAEPIFMASRLHSYRPGKSATPDYFHFDVGDALSLTLFVFLTDVDDEQAGPHYVVAGTHRTKTLQELWARHLDDDTVHAHYPDRVHTIMGKRGTAWFEDTLAFHKHGYVGKIRKAFSLQYSLHRKECQR